MALMRGEGNIKSRRGGNKPEDNVFYKILSCILCLSNLRSQLLGISACRREKNIENCSFKTAQTQALHREVIFLEKHYRYTVVSAYKPPGYKPTSASVPLKEFPYCFCYPLHSKVSVFSPTGYKHKPASVLRNCPPKPAKNLFVSRLLKIIC